MGLPNEQPTFTTSVDDFFIDAHPVTVGEFRKFVKATGYQTEAERFGDAGVFNVEKLQQMVRRCRLRGSLYGKAKLPRDVRPTVARLGADKGVLTGSIR